MERVLNLPETRRAPRGANALVLPVDHDRARGCASSDVLRHRQALFGHARSDKGIADRVATHDVPLLRDVLRGTRAGDMRGRVAQRLVQHVSSMMVAVSLILFVLPAMSGILCPCTSCGSC